MSLGSNNDAVDQSKHKRGLLVVFEGIDGSGKSTHASILSKVLRDIGHEVHEMRFPDRLTPIGILCDETLQGNTSVCAAASNLLFSANRWELDAEMKTRIANGEIVVCDRYVDSGIAYGFAKLFMERDCPVFGAKVDLDLLAFAESLNTFPIIPDLTIFMDTSLEEAKRRRIARSSKCGDHSIKSDVTEDDMTLRLVLGAYKHIATCRPNWVTIGTDGQIEEIAQNVLSVISKKLLSTQSPTNTISVE